MMRIAAVFALLAMLFSSAPLAQAAETGVATPALSYCAHWFARDGNACVTSASTGQLVVPDANNRQQVEAAMNHCKQAGCKVALYCECGYNGVGAAQVAQLFADTVKRHGTGVIIPQVEVDHIADITAAKRTAVITELAKHGFGLILKNSADVAAISTTIPVVRVVYEDIVHDAQYRNAMLGLAKQHPNLLITGIVHQGSYGPELGGQRDPGATPQQADAVFAQFKDFKNVELFYGMPTSFKRAKSFDGQMDSLAREIGRGTLTPGGPGSLTPGTPSPGPFSQPDNRLLGDVRKMLQPSNPYAQIAPASNTPLPSYLNPLPNMMPPPIQPIAPSALSAPTSSASSLLDLLSSPTPSARQKSSVSVNVTGERPLTPTRTLGAKADGPASGSTTVTTFPIVRSVPENVAAESIFLHSVRLAIDGITRILTSILAR